MHLSEPPWLGQNRVRKLERRDFWVLTLPRKRFQFGSLNSLWQQQEKKSICETSVYSGGSQLWKVELLHILTRTNFWTMLSLVHNV